MTERRLPAEWEPQSGIMLTWPHANTDWGKALVSVEPVFTSICSHVSHHEKVLIVANDDSHQAHINNYLSKSKTNMSNIVFALADSNDSWARDHGAITVHYSGDKPLLLDFHFNGWGEKYDYELDDKITKSLIRQQVFNVPYKSVNFILEGGSIESDGAGTLLTTDCLISSRRNTGLSQSDIEVELKSQLGVTTIHWLHHGYLIGDDTDAHIDTLARFVSSNKIAYVKCDDSSDKHYQPLRDMEAELSTLKTAEGKPYELVPLPLPDAVFNADGDRLPATYANFLIINQCVLLPVYDQPADQEAKNAIKSCFPDREIITINCLPLIEQFGSLHCVTMQFPKGVLAQ